MPLIVPYPSAPVPPTVSLTVVAPSFQVTFYADTTTVQINTVMSIQTSLGRTSPRTDGTAAGQATVVVDDTARILDADNPSSPLYGKLTPGGKTTVAISAWDGTNWIPLFTGLIEQIDTSWPGGTSYSEAQVQLVDQQRDLNLDIPPITQKFPAQQTGARIAALLGARSRSQWGWINRSRSNSFDLDAGQKVLGPLQCDGQSSTWSYVAADAAAEKGMAFFNQAGVPSFHDQARRYRSGTPRWVFGDNTGELMVDPALSLSLPNDRTLTDVAYTSSDGVTATYGPNGLTYTSQFTDSDGNVSIFTEHNGTITVTPQDLNSNSPVSSASAVPLADKYQAGARAAWEYHTYSENRRDAPNLVIDAFGEWPSVSSPSRFACALYARISDYCRLNRRPGGSTITKYYWIDGIAHDIQAGPDASWKATFTTVAADPIPNYWQLGVTKLSDVEAIQW